ncbi:hypothetical protein Tco_1369590 [Tanacetum coccineum]
MVLAYKSGLESVEEKLEVYKANKSIYSQDINVLKFEIECKDIAIRVLRKKLEIAQKEKDRIQFNVDKFENASKILNKLIERQIVDNCKKCLGYNAVPPPYTGNFMPSTPDLSFTGLDKFVNKHVVENRKSDEEVSRVVRKSNDYLIIEDWVSDSKEENVSQTKTVKKIVKHSIAKIEFVKLKQQEKTARKTVKQVEKDRQNTHSPRGNQRNWNNMMSQKLGSNFEMFNMACYVCGSFDHLQVDCNYHHKQFQKQRMVKPVWNNAQRYNTDRQVNVAHPKTTVNVVRPIPYLSKKAHSTGNPQMDLQDKGVIDSGCLRHMKGNMSYLTDYKEIDGGYVAFLRDPKGNLVRGLPSKLFEMIKPVLLVKRKANTQASLAVNMHAMCPVTILNTIDPLGKFDGKADEGVFVGYSLNSSGPDWLFDIDALTRTMNYEPIVVGTQSNGFACAKASDNVDQARNETEPVKDYILLPLWTANLPYSQDPKSSQDDGTKPSSDDGKKVDKDPRKYSEGIDQEKEDNVNNTNNANAASTNEVNAISGKTSIELPLDQNILELEDYSIFEDD